MFSLGKELDRTLLYFLIFTIISSWAAYYIVVKAYASFYDESYYQVE